MSEAAINAQVKVIEKGSNEAGGSFPELQENKELDSENLPLPIKIFSVLCQLGGIATFPMAAMQALAVINLFREGGYSNFAASSVIITFVFIGMLVVMAASFIVFGFRLLRDKRRHAALVSELLMFLSAGCILCDVMLFGISTHLVFFGIILVLLVALEGYIDPSLAQERELQRHLRNLETKSQVEKGTLGLDTTGKGYISLNFFNLFWIFTVCCVLGLLVETIYHVVIVDPGHYEDRAGMLFGPFSPIYGFGGLLMTLALNQFHKKPVIFIFLVSAIIGGAFEYLTSWFMEFAFGAVAWDYTGTFLSIGGRTNAMFMAMWGVLGVLWIKLLLPWMLKLVNLIPWKLRYTITSVCAVLMIIDGVMTLQALDCWYERLAGRASDVPVEQFYAEHFDNAYMDNRFQSMSINPDAAARSSVPDATGSATGSGNDAGSAGANANSSSSSSSA